MKFITVSLHIAPRDMSSWSAGKQARALVPENASLRPGFPSSNLPVATTAVAHTLIRARSDAGRCS